MIDVLGTIKNRQMLLLLIFTYMPIGFYLKFHVSIVFFSLCFFHIFTQITTRDLRPFYIKILAFLTIFYLILIYDFSIINLDFGASFLSLLLVVKYMEARSRRDYYIFLFLMSFLPVVFALYEQSVFTGIYLIFFILGFMYNLNYNCIDSKNIKICYLTFIQSIPLVIILFLFVPRLPSGFIGIAKKDTSYSGLSTRVQPGDISRLVLSDDVAFRIKFNNFNENLDSLYFRCAVHTNCYKGMCSISRQKITNLSIRCMSKKIGYKMFLEASYNNFVPILEMPVQVPKIHSISVYEGAFFMSSKKITAPIGYISEACLNYNLQPSSKEEVLQALKIDESQNLKTQKLVDQLVNRYKNPLHVIDKILSLYKKDFYYSLNPPIWPKKDPIDFFLFTSKKGFCEHYAVATVYMLRYANIPARVITGYVGGEKNPLGDYVIVRQSNAHAWVEAYVDEKKGFIRIDPTRYIPKQNVESSVYDAQQKTFIVERDFLFFFNFVRIWDYVNYKWRELIVNYDYRKQSSFFSKIGLNPRDIKIHSIVILIILSALLSGLFIVYIFLSKNSHNDEIARYYLIFINKLKKMGFEVDASKGPLEILEIIRSKRGDFIKEAEDIIQLYIKMRFQEIITNLDLKNFKDMVRRF